MCGNADISIDKRELQQAIQDCCENYMAIH